MYVWEDNSPETYSISLEGNIVQSNHNSGTGGTWSKLGPYQAVINDGAINLAFTGGASNLSGVEVWRVNQQGSSARLALASEASGNVQEENNGEGTDLTAFPNPFAEKVNITFTATESGPTQLALYDVRGISLRVLFQAQVKAGHTENLEMTADNLPGGVYVLELVNGQKRKRIRVMISR
jgi:hypothetical protein